LFSTSTDAEEERQEFGAPASGPQHTLKAVDEEARLARMVLELHGLEDDVVAKLTEAERVLVQLATRRVHEDGGYASWAEFEERMLASSPVLRAMRTAIPDAAPPPRTPPGAAKRDRGDARARQAKALTATARALDRMRAIDAEILRCASAARSALHTIDVMRIYDECGYASFEEFLERAIGPSPVLASTLALVANETAAKRSARPPPLPEAGAPPPVEADDLSASVFEDSAESAVGPEAFSTPSGVSLVPAPEAAPSPNRAAPPRQGRAGIAIAVLLCTMATILGSAAGICSGHLWGAASSVTASGPNVPPAWNDHAGDRPAKPSAAPAHR
jgi:hypothetical protein